MKPRLLVVEDEVHLGRAIKLNFELEGFAVDVASTGKAALRELLRPEPYAAIVLDVQLPDTDGFDLCRRLREAGDFTPVIMLTVRAAPEDRVAGLEAGADDYLPKPFEFHELLARIRAMLRRQRWVQSTQTVAPRPRVIRFGRVAIDLDSHEAQVDGKAVTLTALELDLVSYFAAHPGRVLSRNELLAEVWKLPSHPQTRTVDNFVARLRKHFEIDAANPVHFVSHRGTGYRFMPDGAVETASDAAQAEQRRNEDTR